MMENLSGSDVYDGERWLAWSPEMGLTLSAGIGETPASICGEEVTAAGLGPKHCCVVTGDGREVASWEFKNDDIDLVVSLRPFWVRCRVIQIACSLKKVWARTERLEVFEMCACDVSEARQVYGLIGIPVLSIAAGNHHQIAVSAGGDVYAWGLNRDGRCGVSKRQKKIQEPRAITRRRLALNERYAAATAAGNRTALLTSMGAIFMCPSFPPLRLNTKDISMFSIGFMCVDKVLYCHDIEDVAHYFTYRNNEWTEISCIAKFQFPPIPVAEASVSRRHSLEERLAISSIRARLESGDARQMMTLLGTPSMLAVCCMDSDDDDDCMDREGDGSSVATDDATEEDSDSSYSLEEFTSISSAGEEDDDDSNSEDTDEQKISSSASSSSSNKEEEEEEQHKILSRRSGWKSLRRLDNQKIETSLSSRLEQFANEPKLRSRLARAIRRGAQSLQSRGTALSQDAARCAILLWIAIGSIFSQSLNEDHQVRRAVKVVATLIAQIAPAATGDECRDDALLARCSAFGRAFIFTRNGPSHLLVQRMVKPLFPILSEAALLLRRSRKLPSGKIVQGLGMDNSTYFDDDDDEDENNSGFDEEVSSESNLSSVDDDSDAEESHVAPNLEASLRAGQCLDVLQRAYRLAGGSSLELECHALNALGIVLDEPDQFFDQNSLLMHNRPAFKPGPLLSDFWSWRDNRKASNRKALNNLRRNRRTEQSANSQYHLFSDDDESGHHEDNNAHELPPIASGWWGYGEDDSKWYLAALGKWAYGRRTKRLLFTLDEHRRRQSLFRNSQAQMLADSAANAGLAWWITPFFEMLAQRHGGLDDDDEGFSDDGDRPPGGDARAMIREMMFMMNSGDGPFSDFGVRPGPDDAARFDDEEEDEEEDDEEDDDTSWSPEQARENQQEEERSAPTEVRVDQVSNTIEQEEQSDESELDALPDLVDDDDSSAGEESESSSDAVIRNNNTPPTATTTTSSFHQGIHRFQNSHSVQDVISAARRDVVRRRVRQRVQNLSSEPRVSQAEQSPFFVIKVKRGDDLALSVLEAVGRASDDQLCKRELRVKFCGEPGVDEGGVRKELFEIITPQLFDSSLGMFLPTDTENMTGKTLYFNPQCDWYLDKYSKLGALCGVAFAHGIPLAAARLPTVAYKKLLQARPDEKNDASTSSSKNKTKSSSARKKQCGSSNHHLCAAQSEVPLEELLCDLAQIDEYLAEGLRQLLHFEPRNQIEQVYQRTFVVGEPPVPLVPGGEKKLVSHENRRIFVRLLANHIIHTSIAEQFNRFAAGFWRTGARFACLELIDVNDFKYICQGRDESNHNLDWDALRSVTKYTGWDSSSNWDNQSNDHTRSADTHPVVREFWLTAKSLDHVAARDLLKFILGSEEAPIGGLGALRPPEHRHLTIQRAGPDSDRLPTVHVCFNTLLIPDYNPATKTGDFIRRAIVHNRGFGLR